MRTDVQDSTGVIPVRPSASTQTQSTSSSSTTLGSLSLVKAGGLSSANNPTESGQEVDIHNLLVIDQHTFEGLL